MLNKPKIAILVVCGVIFFSALLFCNLRPLSGDEAFSVFYAQQDLSVLIDCLKNDTNPPFYFIILHFWIKIFGNDLFYVRMLSVIFGSAAAFVFGLVINKIFSLKISLLTLVLLFLSNSYLYYNHEVRCFSLLLLLTGLSTYYFYLLFEEKSESKWHVLFFTLINLLMLYTHYLALFFIFVQGVYFIFPLKNILKYKYISISYIFLCMIFLPWFLIITHNIPQAGTFWLKKPTVDNYYFEFVYLVGQKLIFFEILILSALALVIRTYKIWFEKYIVLPNWLIYFLMLGFLPSILLFFTAQITPVFLMRYFLYSLFPLLVVVSIVIMNIKLKKIRLAILSIVLITFLCNFSISPPKEENWEAVSRKVKIIQSIKSTKIIVDAEYKTRDFLYYFNRSGFNNYPVTSSTLNDSLLLAQNIFPFIGIQSLPELNKNENVIVILSQNKDNGLVEYLEKLYAYSRVYTFDNHIGKVVVFSNEKFKTI